MADVLSDQDRRMISESYLRFVARSCVTSVDGQVVADAAKVIEWFAIAAGSNTIGLVKTRTMIARYEAFSLKNEGARTIKVNIRTSPVGVTST